MYLLKFTHLLKSRALRTSYLLIPFIPFWKLTCHLNRDHFKKKFHLPTINFHGPTSPKGRWPENAGKRYLFSNPWCFAVLLMEEVLHHLGGEIKAKWIMGWTTNYITGVGFLPSTVLLMWGCNDGTTDALHEWYVNIVKQHLVPNLLPELDSILAINHPPPTTLRNGRGLSI